MRIEHFETLDSTSREAERRAKGGPEHGLWIQADHQSSGIGRRGRAWSSNPGNLFATGLYHHPEGPAHAALLSFAAALAVYDVIKAFAPDADVSLKWPNDVHIDGAKVAGILLQSGKSAGVDWISIGVGINLLHHPDDTPYRATHIAAHMDITDPEEIPQPLPALAVLARRFESYRDQYLNEGFAPIRAAWLEKAHGVDQTVTANLGERKITGVMKDISANGELRVRLTDGTDTLISSGEVFFS